MENPEEVLQSLDEFAKLKPKDIPRELEDYLSYVAKTGDPVYQWPIVKCLFREKLLNVITDFYETSPTIDLPPCPNVDPFNYETMKNSLLERLESFSSAPFTVQRLCELLTTPRKEYSRADKFMRAVEKNILVVSTREPGSVRRSDNNGQPELLMNGVMDGRGIELGEAIETVSSEGVNLMHSEENEVNVTDSGNVVPVECAGMEEIDMDEQGDMSTTSSSTTAWEKDQPEAAVQSAEESNLKTYDESNSEEVEESKPKENAEPSESSEASSQEAVSESKGEDSDGDIGTSTDSVVNSAFDVVEESSKTLDTTTESSPDKVENTTADVEVSSSDCDVNPQPETSTPETEDSASEVVEKEGNVGNMPPDTSSTVSESSTPLDEESVASSSNDDDEPTADSNAEESVSTVEAPSNSEVITETSEEPETVERPNSSTLDPVVSNSTAEEPSVDSKTEPAHEISDAAEKCSESPDVVASSVLHVEEETAAPNSSVVNVSDTSAVDEECEKKEEAVPASVEEDEAMEVDENVVSSQMTIADMDEPMDQSDIQTDS